MAGRCGGVIEGVRPTGGQLHGGSTSCGCFCKVYELEDLEKITDNFSEERLLGEGGFGKVYKGLLQNGDMIAVKKLTSTLPGIKDRQFDNEAQHLMRLSHPNIVQLVGYCSHTEEILVQHKGRYVYAEKSEKLLCLEYLPKGSLHEHLSDESSGLDWDMRFKIIEGICNGLHYLHEKWQASTSIIHMDLKPKNILLDDNMMPKIADFGLSRLFGEEQTRTCTANRDGTLGYMAPEYLNRGIITKKLDIFSLGVIIIEIITGNKDYPDETETSSQEFIELVLKNWRNRLGKAPRYTAAFSIFPSFCREQIRRCIQIGLACVKLNRVKRPTTLEILSMLHKSEGAECINGKEAQNDGYTDQSVRYPLLKQSSSDIFKIEPDGLKKFDSFSRWMNNELPEVADLDINSSSDAFWSTTETVNVADGSSIPINEQLDAFVVSPSLSQDQLFSIIDVSPSWAYNGTKTKVLIVGTFLAKNEDVENCRWSCMFGDVEVSAEVLVDGSLRCYTPVHHSGRVPFYVTCSNRVACSEVREFEFRGSEAHYMETSDQHTTDINEMHLHIRLDKLLSLEPEDYEKYVLNNGNKSELIDTISSLMLDDKLSSLTLPSDEKELSTLRDQNLEKQVKEKLYYWLIHKIHDDEKGPNDQGKEGQGVIHLVAALGYDWAIKPIVAAGVNINLDIRGWSALHWAASCGRERTVGALIANGASPGALTDPTQLYPSGRTPADLASENGHKGIAGFLAESALTSHLSALTLKESQGGNVEEVCGFSDEYTLSLVSLRNPKSGHSDLHSAAVHIQNKFRGWKGRLEFMIIRQRIVKIQAHIRGHQVRKNYRKVVWSVGIVEKVILRWRKRRDLRGFQPEKHVGGPSWQIQPSKAENEDEYDCLMLKRALAHVRSMQQYPEARDQYRRLQDCVNRLQESQDRMLADAAAPDGDDFMAELEKTSVVLPHPHLNRPSCL